MVSNQESTAKLNVSSFYHAQWLEGGPVLAYPIAAGKQSNADDIIKAKTKADILLKRILPPSIVGNIHTFNTLCDFDIIVNSTKSWYFGRGNIGQDETDIRIMAARLITEGLGFSSNLIKIESERPDHQVVTPKKDQNRASAFFLRPTALDNIIYGVSPEDDRRNLGNENTRLKPISKILDQIDRSGIYRWNISKTVPLNDLRLRIPFRNLYQLMNRPVQAKFSDGTCLEIIFTAEGMYETYSTMGPEFLMSNSTRNVMGITLEDLMRQNNASDIYGPLTLKVFHQSGFMTQTMPVPMKLKLPTSWCNLLFGLCWLRNPSSAS